LGGGFSAGGALEKNKANGVPIPIQGSEEAYALGSSSSEDWLLLSSSDSEESL